jgi:hypothetical protein
LFGIAEFLRPRHERASLANDAGYNDAWLGLAYNNPFPLGTIDYKQYEWGYNQAQNDVDELADAPSFYPSNEYEDYI